jgi:cold shock CspA family protein
MLRVHSGFVVSFDEKYGAGEVAEGTDPEQKTDQRTYFFHATKLTDGTRSIAVGTAVTFQLRAGGKGRYEAIEVSVASIESSVIGIRCPVCSAAIDGEPRAYEICGTCGWEDDPVQFDDPAYRGGANSESLNDARIAWATQLRTG